MMVQRGGKPPDKRTKSSESVCLLLDIQWEHSMKTSSSKMEKFLVNVGFVAVSMAFWLMFLNCVL